MTPQLRSLHEDRPGPRWQAAFRQLWPHYRRWWRSEGEQARPAAQTARAALARAVPEFMPCYERLVELAGGGDEEAAFLSLYRPPRTVVGCTQAAWTRGEPFLVRNYDYAPHLWEGLLLRSAWSGRATLAMTDCLVGALDGLNEAGLCVSLNFGGRRGVGHGFGAPLLLRCLLELCETVAEAAALARRIPTHMAYNVLVLDRHGEFLTVFTAPGGRTRFKRVPVSTNHQGRVYWSGHAAASATVERERHLMQRFADRSQTPARLVAAFLDPPLRTTNYRAGFGTLYTAVYHPGTGQAEYLWPRARLVQSLAAFREGTHAVDLASIDRTEPGSGASIECAPPEGDPSGSASGSAPSPHDRVWRARARERAT